MTKFSLNRLKCPLKKMTGPVTHTGYSEPLSFLGENKSGIGSHRVSLLMCNNMLFESRREISLRRSVGTVLAGFPTRHFAPFLPYFFVADSRAKGLLSSKMPCVLLFSLSTKHTVDFRPSCGQYFKLIWYLEHLAYKTFGL